jgi:hypothetical protein
MAQMSLVADKKAEVTKIEGNSEAELKAVLSLRRLYDYMNSKLRIVTAMGSNSNLKIFGAQSDGNAMA